LVYMHPCLLLLGGCCSPRHAGSTLGERCQVPYTRVRPVALIRMYTLVCSGRATARSGLSFFCVHGLILARVFVTVGEARRPRVG
jgi:hypothetical protein